MTKKKQTNKEVEEKPQKVSFSVPKLRNFSLMKCKIEKLIHENLNDVCDISTIQQDTLNLGILLTLLEEMCYVEDMPEVL